MATTEGKPEVVQRFACPKCGTEVARRAMLCPNCREPLTGENAPVPVRPKPKAKPPTPPPPREEVAGLPKAGSSIRRNAMAMEEEEDTGPPLGRAVPDKQDFFRRALATIETAWGSTTRRQAKRRYTIMAAVFAAIGLIMIGRMLYRMLLPPSGSSPPPVESVTVLSSQVQDLDSHSASRPVDDSLRIAPSPPDSSGSRTDAPVKVKPSPSTAEEKDAKILLAAADQLERLAHFLVPSSSDPKATPMNPKGWNDVIPPLAKADIPGPNASPEEKSRFEQLLRKRQRMALGVAGFIARARELGISGERTAAVAGKLREKAAEMVGKPESDASPSPTSHWAAPAQPLSRQDIEETIRTLLGDDEGNDVVRIYEK